jgi:hypothetical protein
VGSLLFSEAALSYGAGIVQLATTDKEKSFIDKVLQFMLFYGDRGNDALMVKYGYQLSPTSNQSSKLPMVYWYHWFNSFNSFNSSH